MEAIDSKEEIKLSACKQSNRVGQSRLGAEKQIYSSKKETRAKIPVSVIILKGWVKSEIGWDAQRDKLSRQRCWILAWAAKEEGEQKSVRN